MVQIKPCEGWEVLSASQVCLPDKKNCKKVFIRVTLRETDDMSLKIPLFIPVDDPGVKEYQLVVNEGKPGLRAGDTVFWIGEYDEPEDWHPGILVDGTHESFGLGPFPLMQFGYKEEEKGEEILLVQWAHAWGLHLKIYGGEGSIAPINIEGRRAIEVLIKSLQMVLERYDSGQFEEPKP